ncbi:hypothetical protein JCM19239_7173 [Vibrio variabilis]|uniref:Uncharacterized protein n=1 Tax=Vibrio variabilis TaxID=990271 RepID=A0ABQ0JK44_9VIBR|nr:hypothetical protein JCM19239_7173 [Vibrio variabilis]
MLMCEVHDRNVADFNVVEPIRENGFYYIFEYIRFVLLI